MRCTHTPPVASSGSAIQQLSKKSFTARFSTEGYYIGQALQGFKIRVGQITFKKRKHYILFCLTSFSLHCIWPVRYYYSKRLVKGLLFFSFGKGLTLTTTTQTRNRHAGAKASRHHVDRYNSYIYLRALQVAIFYCEEQFLREVAE